MSGQGKIQRVVVLEIIDTNGTHSGERAREHVQKRGEKGEKESGKRGNGKKI